MKQVEGEGGKQPGRLMSTQPGQKPGAWRV